MVKQQQRGLRRSGGQGLPVQSIFEDGFDVLVRVSFEGHGSGTSGFQTLSGIAFLQTEQPEAGAITLLRVGSGFQDQKERTLEEMHPPWA